MKYIHKDLPLALGSIRAYLLWDDWKLAMESTWTKRGENWTQDFNTYMSESSQTAERAKKVNKHMEYPRTRSEQIGVVPI